MRKNNTYNLILTLQIMAITIPLIFFSSGCTMVAHDMTIDKYPFLHTTIAQAPPQNPAYSRVVVYSPRAPLGGFSVNPIEAVGGWDVLPVIIEGQAGIFRGDILDQTGYYIDIPPGDYKITGKPTAIVDDKKIINTSFAASKIYVIKAESEVGVVTSKTPVISDDIDQAMKDMEKRKVRYCPPTGMTKSLKRLPLQPTLIPKAEAKSIWESSPLPQSKQDSAARVYILNRTCVVGAALRPLVGVDCLPDIEIDKTKYICFEVTPGRHILSAKVGCFTKEGYMPAMGFIVDVNAGQDFFIDFDPIKGFGFVTQDKAQELVKKPGKLAKNGYYRRISSSSLQ
ncbi:MAG: hypothetical protein LLF92_00675 [Planctomycetaceae bacterium]|nr:hypothetical protein [Planctomycetaceae bacterium]